MTKISSHNSWDKLEEIWLGDVWPEHFYDDLDPEVKDAFYKLTEITKEDLNIIQKKFEEFGVTVRRPTFKEKENYIIPGVNKLSKPPITPRDEGCVIGDTLYLNYGGKNPWEDVVTNYDKDKVIITNELEKHLMSANIARIGRDIIFDHLYTTEPDEHYFKRLQHLIDEFGDNYRIHFTMNGGHSDGCFATPKPELLLCTEYFSDYDVFFPGWKRINLREPTYAKSRFVNKSGSSAGWKKWHIADDGKFISPHFNSYLENYCLDWIGDYTETYFEVNTVMLDEKNIMCLGEHEELFKEFERNGITPHVVPFRARTFWDGGLHCLTLDIRRQGELVDYFPDRGAYGKGIVPFIQIDDFANRFTEWQKNR